MTSNSRHILSELEIAQNASIEYLALSGGGVKGGAYSGAYAGLVSAGIMKDIKAISGSSAGAISAAFIATGMSSEEFTEISKNMDFAKLLGNAKRFGISKTATPLYDLLDNNIRSNIYDFLQKNPLQKLKEAGIPTARIVDANNLMARCARRDKIYFKDLALMRSIAPDHFKDLIITATDKGTGELKIFSAQNTPDVEIALAAKASAAFPIVLETVKINGREYVDGGYQDNTPITHFSDHNNTKQEVHATEITNSPEEIQTAKQEGRTLALAFGSYDKDSTLNIALFSASEKIYSPGKFMQFIYNVIVKMISGIGGKGKYSEAVDATYQRIRKNALDTVAIDTKEVTTLSFDKAKKQVEYLHTKGYCSTMSHCNNYGIGKIDPHIEFKSFFLEIYEKTTAKQSAANNLFQAQQEQRAIKHKALLSFSAPEKQWQESESKEVLSQYIATAATDHKGVLTPNTKTMQKLIATLNAPTTSNKIKESFIDVLSLDRSKDSRLNQQSSQNLTKFQFSQSDFAQFLKDNPKLALPKESIKR